MAIPGERMKKVVLTFARMNPITSGHAKLVDKIKAEARRIGGDPKIYLSHSTDAKRNPLDYNKKVLLAKRAFGPSVIKSSARNIFDALKELEKKYTDAVIVVGSDRVSEFKALMIKYNNKDFHFNTINVISAGERDQDSDNISGISATKMRAAVAAGDYDFFKKGTPTTMSDKEKKDMYNTIKRAMHVEETEVIEDIEDLDFTDDQLDAFILSEDLDALDEADDIDALFDLEHIEEAPLSIQARLKRARAMRRLAPRMKRKKEIQAKRMADPKRLAKRSRRAAIKILRKRYAGAAGKRYASLSPTAKISVDRLIANKMSMIKRIATRLGPKVRKAEMARLQRSRTHKEEVDINSMFENFIGSEEIVESRSTFKDFSEAVVRRTDVKLVKVRLPDGRSVWKREKPAIEIGSGKYESVQVGEDVDIEQVDEKTLTPNEKRKKEEIVLSLKKKGMASGKAHAIATATAKRVTESMKNYKEEVEQVDEINEGKLETLDAWAKKHEKLGHKITKDNKTGRYHAWNGTKHLDAYTAKRVTESVKNYKDSDPVDSMTLSILSDMFKDVHGFRPRGTIMGNIKTMGQADKEFARLERDMKDEADYNKQRRIERNLNKRKKELDKMKDREIQKNRSWGPSSSATAMANAFANARRKGMKEEVEQVDESPAQWRREANARRAITHKNNPHNVVRRQLRLGKKGFFVTKASTDKEKGVDESKKSPLMRLKAFDKSRVAAGKKPIFTDKKDGKKTVVDPKTEVSEISQSTAQRHLNKTDIEQVDELSREKLQKYLNKTASPEAQKARKKGRDLAHAKQFFRPVNKDGWAKHMKEATSFKEPEFEKPDAGVKKVDLLLRAGLVPRKDVGKYRLALKNPSVTSKSPVLRAKISELLQRLLDMTTKDPLIFNKLRANVAKIKGVDEQLSNAVIKTFVDLKEKADDNDVPLFILVELFGREDDINKAYNRVNSFINNGAARNIDSDLAEQLALATAKDRIKREKMDDKVRHDNMIDQATKADRNFKSRAAALKKKQSE
jgi:hypothetical protein